MIICVEAPYNFNGRIYSPSYHRYGLPVCVFSYSMIFTESCSNVLFKCQSSLFSTITKQTHTHRRERARDVSSFAQCPLCYYSAKIGFLKEKSKFVTYTFTAAPDEYDWRSMLGLHEDVASRKREYLQSFNPLHFGLFEYFGSLFLYVVVYFVCSSAVMYVCCIQLWLAYNYNPALKILFFWFRKNALIPFQFFFFFAMPLFFVAFIEIFAWDF